MKTVTTTLLSTVLALGTLAAVAPSASAGERICRGTIGKVTIDGDVKVPTGANCTLQGTYVKGNVKVSNNAMVYSSMARVNGNIQTECHRLTKVYHTRVLGSIQVKQGAAIDLRHNNVNGDMQLFSNRTGNKYVYTNRVGGNLQCKSNVPAPKGAGNIVKGNKEDQCRRF